ncbi:MAG: hypothetical protein ACXVAX_03030 [Pseudobdellovibrio sp.]
MRKLLSSLLVLFFISLASTAHAQSCEDAFLQGGIEPWPWSVAQPFPWDNIAGWWQFGDDDSSYIRAVVQSSTQDRKLLKIYVYGDGACSKPYAVGTGYISIAEKNVVRSLLSDSDYKYQLKLGLFDARDVSNSRACSHSKLMAASMQIISRAHSNVSSIKDIQSVPTPLPTDARNILLKKVSADPSVDCNNESFK